MKPWKLFPIVGGVMLISIPVSYLFFLGPLAISFPEYLDQYLAGLVTLLAFLIKLAILAVVFSAMFALSIYLKRLRRKRQSEIVA